MSRIEALAAFVTEHSKVAIAVTLVLTVAIGGAHRVERSSSLDQFTTGSEAGQIERLGLTAYEARGRGGERVYLDSGARRASDGATLNHRHPATRWQAAVFTLHPGAYACPSFEPTRSVSTRTPSRCGSDLRHPR